MLFFYPKTCLQQTMSTTNKRSNAMTVFVTGATGYIGHAVAEGLSERGHTVVGLARSDASAERLRRRGYRVQRGDLTDRDALQAAARQADAVIHQAADGEDMVATDTAAVHAMLDALRDSDRSLIYTSGVWVLGHTGRDAADEDAPTDAIPLVAWRPALERDVLAAGGTVIRPAIVYGRGGGIPAMLVDEGRERGAVRYVGDGTQHWPVVHVDDLADLYVRALDAPGGTLLHAASGASHPMRAIAEAASHAAGVPGRVEAWPLDTAREALGSFADALALDQRVSGDRAKEMLGWRPEGPSIIEEIQHGSYVHQHA